MQQIVIDLDENIYTRLFDNGEDYTIVNDDLFAIAKAIRNGTPLPEHHGDLKDADMIKEHLKACFQNGRPMYKPELHEVLEMVESVEPVIPATKEEIHCYYTTEEIAKSFIEDVSAVKDQLPKQTATEEGDEE